MRDGHVRRTRGQDGGAVRKEGEEDAKPLGGSSKVGGFNARGKTWDDRRGWRSMNLQQEEELWTKQATTLAPFQRRPVKNEGRGIELRTNCMGQPIRESKRPRTNHSRLSMQTQIHPGPTSRSPMLETIRNGMRGDRPAKYWCRTMQLANQCIRNLRLTEDCDRNPSMQERTPIPPSTRNRRISACGWSSKA